MLVVGQNASVPVLRETQAQQHVSKQTQQPHEENARTSERRRAERTWCLGSCTAAITQVNRVTKRERRRWHTTDLNGSCKRIAGQLADTAPNESVSLHSSARSRDNTRRTSSPGSAYE